MERYEKRYLIGLFLILVGVFMPWFGVADYSNMFGSVTRVVGQVAYGYGFVPGWIIFITALGLVLQFLIKPEWLREKRFLFAQKFFLLFILVIFFFGGIVPVFSEHLLDPHVGLLSVLLGSITALLAVRQLKY